MKIADAIKLHQAGQVEEAAEMYRAILATDANHVDALHFLGMCVMQQGRMDEADRLTEKAARLRPDDAQLLSNRGELLRRLGRFDEARALLERAVALTPNVATRIVNLAVLSATMSDYERAEQYVVQALKIDLTNRNALNLFHRLCEHVDCHHRAAQAFRDAITAHPHDLTLRRSYSQLLYHFGDPDDAEASIEELIKEMPADAALHFQLGELQFRCGDVRTAIASLRTATDLDATLAIHKNGRLIAARIVNLRDATERSGGSVIVTNKAHVIDLPTPEVLPKSSSQYWLRRPERIPDAYVTMLTDCEVIAHGFVVLSKDRELFLHGLTTSPALFPKKKGSVAYWDKDGRVLLDLPASPPLYEQECALLGGGANHFHFTLEGLPRIFSLRAAGLTHLPIVVSENLHDTQLEMLARLGYDRTKLIMLSEFGSAKFTRLYVPTLLSRGYALTSTGINFLREFLPQIPRRLDLPKRIYISRNKFGRRKIVNEDELMPLLRTHGFETFYPEQMTFPEQVQLFNNASVILSLEGSAMANLAFAEPGTRVGLINPVGLYVPHYYFVSAQLEHRFTYLEAQPLPQTHALLAHQDLRLKPEILQEWLAGIDN